MFRFNRIAWTVFVAATCALAGDDASGPIPYSVDLAAPFTTYKLSAENREWSRSLVKNLGYNGTVVHFVRTTLLLHVNDTVKEGAVYQAIEMPDRFYVAPGDAMLRIGSDRLAGPGTGGFSMHAPKSRDFIVCLNCEGGGVPFSSGSKVSKGKVTWTGHEWSRFQEVE